MRGDVAMLAFVSMLLVLLIVAARSDAAVAGAQIPDARLAPAASRDQQRAVAHGPLSPSAVPEPKRRLLAIDPAEWPPVPAAKWRHLPRTRHDALPRLVRRPQLVKTRRLLRSTTFNPRDLCLSEDGRRAVALAIAETQAAVEALAASLQATGDREFAGLHARGLTRPVQIGKLEAVVQLEKIGSDPVFRQRDDVRYGISSLEMPETRRLESDLHHAGAALVVRLAEAFWAAGALTDEERQALAARARSEVGRRP